MEFTQDQLAELSFIHASDDPRRKHELLMETRRARLEALRMAKEMLMEEAKSKPVDAPGITPEEVIAFAEKILTVVEK